MYCAKCYAALEDEPFGSCQNCAKTFHIKRRRSVLKYPFPSPRTMLRHVLLILLLGGMVAFILAHLEMSQATVEASPTDPMIGGPE